MEQYVLNTLPHTYSVVVGTATQVLHLHFIISLSMAIGNSVMLYMSNRISFLLQQSAEYIILCRCSPGHQT